VSNHQKSRPGEITVGSKRRDDGPRSAKPLSSVHRFGECRCSLRTIRFRKVDSFLDVPVLFKDSSISALPRKKHRQDAFVIGSNRRRLEYPAAVRIVMARSAANIAINVPLRVSTLAGTFDIAGAKPSPW
jgi:hypothetical protein